MNDVDAGEYLTERLRRNNPVPFQQELDRRSRQSRRRGFLSGFVVAMGIVAAAIVASIFPLP